MVLGFDLGLLGFTAWFTVFGFLFALGLVLWWNVV